MLGGGGRWGGGWERSRPHTAERRIGCEDVKEEPAAPSPVGGTKSRLTRARARSSAVPPLQAGPAPQSLSPPNEEAAAVRRAGIDCDCFASTVFFLPPSRLAHSLWRSVANVHRPCHSLEKELISISSLQMVSGHFPPQFKP